MQRVFVVDKNRDPLMPCHPARARELLKNGRAKVLRRYPFTIILLDREGGDVQTVTLKIDPGSKTTGLALVADSKREKRVVWAGELNHRGEQIKAALLSRKQLRRGRRSRKTRYRQPRFDNRRRAEGWIPPSLRSRVDNVLTWVERLRRFTPICAISMELVKFDTQVMQNPEISGVEYQQGELMGYEVREYLLEKFGRKCAYCGATNMPLEIEHIIPKSRGGSNRASNLTLACNACNQCKGNKTAEEFGYPAIQGKAKQPLKDVAAVNTTRWTLYRRLRQCGLPLEVGTGARTKYNRTKQNYPKEHWIDAACVGVSGEKVYIASGTTPLVVKATGRQSRIMCRPDKYGFPRTKAKQGRVHYGFQTGDIVLATIPEGKHTGLHIGRVAVRNRPSFRLNDFDVHPKYLKVLHHADGYSYQ